MPRTHPPYPPEFRRQIVELARQGRSAWDLAKEFEPNPTTIVSWIRAANIEADAAGDADAEEAETTRLRREIEVLREEKEILAKAAAWFAEETGRTPRGRSSS